MKNFTLFLVLLCTPVLCAQDIILTNDAHKIDAKIVEVSKSQIKYKESDNLSGPIHVLDIRDINSIIYENGKVVLYNEKSTEQPSAVTKLPENIDEDSIAILYPSGNILYGRLTKLEGHYVAFILNGKQVATPASQIETVTFLHSGKVIEYHRNKIQLESPILPVIRETPLKENVQETPSQENQVVSINTIAPAQPSPTKTSKVTYEGDEKLDYINIMYPVDIRRYSKLYIMPVDESNVEYPEIIDKKYEALANSLNSFPGIIKFHLEMSFPYLNVIFIRNSDNISLEEDALYLQLKYDQLDMGNHIQTIKISGEVNTDKQKCATFNHKRLTFRRGRSYETILKNEFNDFGDDIVWLFRRIQYEK